MFPRERPALEAGNKLEDSVTSTIDSVLKAIYFRDYLAIGVCAGFLVVLYIFAMIVFIMIKLKQVRSVMDTSNDKI